MAACSLYWGDIHNHNELGYAQGSLERSYEIARSHLDFYAFTPHGQNAQGSALKGYPIVNENWSRIQRAAAENNVPGAFTTFLGYEWHSPVDVHVIYGEDGKPLQFASTLTELHECFRTQDAILVPHHIAYSDAVDWDLLDEALSPVVEIYSEHGCSERDGGTYPMLGHSRGPGDGRFTAQYGLSLGKRFGFVAGTDNHDGYPGGYGLGLTGVWAEANTREAILDALRQRRTVAVTGDRIEVRLNAGDVAMGGVLAGRERCDLAFDVRGWDLIQQVELVRDNVPVLVRTPNYGAERETGEDLYRLRLEWGWGPMKGYQVFDWEGCLRVEDGRLEQAVPCFCSDPFDEERRKRIVERDEEGCRWMSYTSRGSVLTTRNGTSSCSANDALCLEVRGTERTQLALDLRCRTRKSLLATSADWAMANAAGEKRCTFTIGELLEGRRGFRMERVPISVVMHRALPRTLYTMSGGYVEDLRGSAYYYLRVTQANGQMAWSSPIWVEM